MRWKEKEKRWQKTLLDFEHKLEKLNDDSIKNELLELYKTDPDKAYTEFRIALATKIFNENRELFERLADL